MIPLPALILQRDLEQSPDVHPLTLEDDEEGDVGGVVLDVLAVWVEVDRPEVAAGLEGVAGDVSPYPDPLREGEALDDKLVGAVDGSGDRAGA